MGVRGKGSQYIMYGQGYINIDECVHIKSVASM